MYDQEDTLVGEGMVTDVSIHPDGPGEPTSIQVRMYVMLTDEHTDRELTIWDVAGFSVGPGDQPRPANDTLALQERFRRAVQGAQSTWDDIAPCPELNEEMAGEARAALAPVVTAALNDFSSALSGRTILAGDEILDVVGDAIWEEVKRWPHEPTHPAGIGGNCDTVFGLTGRDLARVALDAATKASANRIAVVREHADNNDLSSEDTAPATAVPSATPWSTSLFEGVWVNSAETILLDKPAAPAVFASGSPLVVVHRAFNTPVGPFEVRDYAAAGKLLGTYGDIPSLTAALIAVGPPEKDTYRTILVERSVAEELRTFLDGRCPADDAVCHHACETLRCWRVANAAPLTGKYPDGCWPDDLKKEADDAE